MGLFRSIFGFDFADLVGSHSYGPTVRAVARGNVKDLITPTLKKMAADQGKAYVEPGLSDAFLDAWYADEDGHILEAIEKSYMGILRKAPTVEEAIL